MEIHNRNFDKIVDGKLVRLLQLEDSHGKIFLCNHGARLVAWEAKDKPGNLVDIVLGFDSIDHYLTANEAYHGVTVGRYANRISEAHFSLDETVYHLDKNLGENHLHGGEKGFHNQVWEVLKADTNQVQFSLKSPHMEGGYPGNVKVTVTYSLKQGELHIEYEAHTDRKTVLSLTHHSYFNLDGEGSGSILEHEAQFYSEYFTPVDSGQIPIGDIIPVYDTPFDFTSWKKIGEDIGSDHEQIGYGGGYDHNFLVKNHHSKDVKQIAEVRSHKSGLLLSCWSNKPAFQFYSANFLDGSDVGKSGQSYKRREAFAIEPQYFPDSPNQSTFPSTALDADEVYTSHTIFKLKTF